MLIYSAECSRAPLIALENAYFQLPQIEQDGADNGRRFRVENGDSPGEKEEVSECNEPILPSVSPFLRPSRSRRPPVPPLPSPTAPLSDFLLRDAL